MVVAVIDDKTIVNVARECGLCTIIEDAGYKDDALWFDGPLYDFSYRLMDRYKNKLASSLNKTDSELRLMCGEMTAQELRTVRAVLGWIKREIGGEDD